MSNGLCFYICFDYHHDMQQISKFFMPYVHSIGFCIFPIPEVPVTQG